MNKKITRSTYIFQWITFVLLVFTDQFSKKIVRETLVDTDGLGKKFNLIKGVLCFQYLENRGSVWGIMQGKISFLLIVSLILFAILVYCYIKLPKDMHYKPLLWLDVIMLAGACGNTIDRLVFGYVTDFIYVELINFPIFNFADCLITVVSVLAVVLILTKYRDCEFDFLAFNGSSKDAGKKDETDGKGNTDN